MPNAPRVYRSGTHEGVDFYDGLACAPIPKGLAVLAAKGGIVVRADWDYVPLSTAEQAQLEARTSAQGFTDPEALDRYRGRQVWIDHGGGIVTRYCHLNGIAPGVGIGAFVAEGSVIGFVGNSGTPESVISNDVENHLHFELRFGSSYLGQGLPPEQVRALFLRAFSP